MNTRHQMKKTVYLHVGSPKTGTTSLQEFLARNTASLAEQGFFVPPHNIGDSGHHELPLSLIKDICDSWYDGWPKISRRSEVVWGELIERINKSECPNVIISSEMFHDIPNHPYSQKIGERIKGSLYEYDVRTIAYIRPVDKYINSIYRQDLENRNSFTSLTKSAQYYKEQRLVHLYPSAWLDFYSSLFGKESLTVRKYDRSEFRNGSIIFDFIDTLGIQYPPEKEPDCLLQENLSIQEDHIDIRRALNTEGTNRQSINTQISNVFTRISDILNEKAPSADLLSEISSEILNEHAIIKERYGVDLGSNINLESTKKQNRDFSEYLQLGLTGLVINQIGEVDRKIDDLARTTFNTLIMPHVRKATPAIIYPAGAHAAWLMQNTILPSANIVACVDRNPGKHDKTRFNAPIITPDDISRYAPGVVFIASPRFGEEILESLLKTLPATTEIVFLS